MAGFSSRGFESRDRFTGNVWIMWPIPLWYLGHATGLVAISWSHDQFDCSVCSYHVVDSVAWPESRDCYRRSKLDRQPHTNIVCVSSWVKPRVFDSFIKIVDMIDSANTLTCQELQKSDNGSLKSLEWIHYFMSCFEIHSVYHVTRGNISVFVLFRLFWNVKISLCLL